MGLTEEPLKIILPILMTSDTQGPPYSFLGTGFFIDADGTFLTAGHVFKDNPLLPGRQYAVMVLTAGLKAHPVVAPTFSDRFDMAMGRVVGVSPTDFFPIAERDARMNDDILTVEFSYTESRRLPDGNRALNIAWASHKGHIVSNRPGRVPRFEGAWMLELPFPALKGASGAPVIVGEGKIAGQVVGMVLANLERHLLPAHIERIETEAGDLEEERRYFLPYAYALSWRHLREFVESVRSQKDS